jgi:hypothetical protein
VATYRELLKHREALQKQIDAAREQEVSQAIDKVRAIIDEFCLTPEQVFPRSNGKKDPKRGQILPGIAIQYPAQRGVAWDVSPSGSKDNRASSF